MKIKRLLSFLLAVMMIVTSVGFTIPISAAETGLNLSQLKAKFPDGKYWNCVGLNKNNADGVTSTPCPSHSGTSTCNGFVWEGAEIAWQCFGFALKLGYDAYGTNPKSWGRAYNLDNIKAGDIINYDGNSPGHTVFVTGVDGNTVYFAECNYGGRCLINWDRSLKKSEFNNLYSVYVAPYELSGGTSSGDSSGDANGSVVTDEIASGFCGAKLKWVLYSDGTLVVSGTGDMWDYNEEIGEEWYGHYKSIKKVIIEDGVTNISDYAFCGMPDLESVIIGDDVTYIGYSAFEDCHSLNEVVLGRKVNSIWEYAFWNASVDTITLSDNLAYLEDWCFGDGYYDYDYSNYGVGISKVIIPDTVESIPYEIYDSYTVKEFEAENTENSIFMSENGVLFHKPSKTLYRYPSNKNDSDSYKVPDWVETISYNAFFNCYDLKHVDLGKGVKTIQSEAFYCSGLQTLTLSDNLESVYGDWLGYEDYWYDDYEYDYELYKVIIPETVKNVPWEIYSIWSISEFDAEDTENSIYMDDNGVLYNKETKSLIRYPESKLDLTSYKVLDWAKNVNSEAFIYNSALNSVEFGKSIKDIGSMLFYETGVSEVTFTGDAPSISFDAFEEITATVYYPYCNSTWTSDVMWDYYGNIVWRPKFTEHSYVPEVIKPTLTQQGYTIYTCVCGEKYIGDYVDPLTVASISVSSNPSKIVYEENDTLNTSGLKIKVTYSDSSTEIISTGFTVSGFDSSSAGLKKVTVSYYGKTTSFDVVVNPHSHVWDDGDIKTAATCTAQGEIKYVCQKCGEVKTETIEALGHNIVKHNAKAATCTEKGWNAYETCSRCDYTTYVEIPALGHSYGDWKETTAATCTAGGMERRDCVNCDHYETRNTEALGHDKVKHNAKAATCTEKGWKAYETCSRCDYTTYVEIPAIGHNYSSVVTPPTTTSEGYTTHTCDRCGDSYVDSYVDRIPVENLPSIIVSTDTGRAGETVTVTVDMKNNPGFGGMAFDVKYDNAVLELVSYELGLGGTICTPSEVDTYADKMNFQYAGISNITGDGTIVTLTFKIKEGAAEGKAEIKVVPEDGTFFRYDGRSEVDISVLCVGGGIEIVNYVKGDINGDGKVNNRDAARLMQYLAGWDVECVENALDVNGDGRVNNRDAARLMQYLAGWEIEIH